MRRGKLTNLYVIYYTERYNSDNAYNWWIALLEVFLCIAMTVGMGDEFKEQYSVDRKNWDFRFK